MPDRPVWFAYTLRGSRLKAWPVTLAGWLVLAAIVGLPVVVLNLLAPSLMARFGSAGLLVGLLALFAVVFPGVIYVVKARGRRVD